MGKGRLKGKSKLPNVGAGPIKSDSPSDVLDGLVRFSLKFYAAHNPKFSCQNGEAAYFHALLGRMKDLSREKIHALTNAKPNATTRFHRIDFDGDGVTEDGFGIPGWGEIDSEAWQFSLSVNEHGRVHGFLIENVFYVVWLDPEHNLYS